MAPQAAATQRVEGWRANPAVVAQREAAQAHGNYREERVPQYELPDVLAPSGGPRVTTADQWERMTRPQTLELFRRSVYGRVPAQPRDVAFDVVETDRGAMEGRATLKRVLITTTGAEGGSFAFEAAVLTPNAAKAPVPALLLINNRKAESADPTRARKVDFWPAERIIERGYAAVVFRTGAVDPDERDEPARAAGVRGVWPGDPDQPVGERWASVAAWAWGASRVLDYLQTDPSIDGRKVMIIGHSRGGKAALWAAAEDSRFAAVVSNNSGCAGAALSRRRLGETVGAVNFNYPHWFCGNFKAYNDREHELPVDQHQLLALIAPRPLYVASADEDLWADPRGEFLSLAHASPVYALYDEPGFTADEMPALDTPTTRGRVAYHIRRGRHALTLYDWQRYLDWADALWPRAE